MSRTRLSVEVEADLKEWAERAADALPKPTGPGMPGKLSQFVRDLLEDARSRHNSVTPDPEAAAIGAMILRLDNDLRSVLWRVLEGLEAAQERRAHSPDTSAVQSDRLRRMMRLPDTPDRGRKAKKHSRRAGGTER